MNLNTLWSTLMESIIDIGANLGIQDDGDQRLLLIDAYENR